MRPKSLILLALALGCGLIASIGITQVIQARNAQKSTVEEKGDVLVALSDIELNTPLSSQNVGLKSWPKDNIPEGAVKKLSDIDGRRPMTRIVKGEVILASKVGTGEAGSRPASDIPPGYRVVAVRANDLAGAGLILPGDRVDVQVYTPRNPAYDIQRTSITTLLTDVRVFAVNSEIRYDEKSDNGKIDAKTISLLVTPQQASKLTLASEVGTVRLVMRGIHPGDTATPPPVSVPEMLGAGPDNNGEKPALPAGLTDFLAKQPDLPKTIEPPVDDVTGRMVVTAGSDTYIAEFHKGEMLPRRVGGENNAGPAQGPQAGPTDGTPPLVPPGGGPKTGPSGGNKDLDR